MLAVVQQAEDLAEHGVLQQRFLLRDDALAEQRFQPIQATAFEQRRFAADLGQQRLLRRQRQHVAAL